MSAARLDTRLILLMTVPPLAWAGNAVVGRHAAQLIAPLELNLWRWIGAALILAPLGWRVLASADSRRRIREHAGYLALLGLLGVGAFNALQYTALKTTSAINATLILSSGPVWSLALGALFFGRRVRGAEVAGAALSLLGVAVVLSGGSLAGLGQLRWVPGDWILLVAVAGWAAYTWMLAQPPAGLHPQDGSAWNWAESLWLQILIGAAWASLGTALHAQAASQGLVETGIDARWGWPLVAIVAYVMVLPSIVAYRCWGLGVQQAGPTMATFFSNLNPVFAALLSALLLGEAPGWHHGLAFLLIVGGIAVGMRGAAR